MEVSGQLNTLNLCFFFKTEHYAMKAYWGSGGTVPRILNRSTRWR